MRVYINFTFDKLELPTEYNHILQAFVLNLIDDEEYRKFLHDKGYTFGKRLYKLFSFSRLLGRFQIDSQTKTIKFFDHVVLIISTADERLIEFVVDRVGRFENLRLGRNFVVPAKIEIFELPETDHIVVSTKSPITVYSTVDKDGKKYTLYHSPHDEIFSKLLEDNLKRKFHAAFGKEFQGQLRIKNIAPNPKRVVVGYKERKLDAWITVLELEGDYEILKLAYDAGLGSKNSAGFGCIELADRDII